MPKSSSSTCLLNHPGCLGADPASLFLNLQDIPGVGTAENKPGKFNMLFSLSLALLVVYVLILLKDKDYRWLGIALAGLYFVVIVVFGDMLRSVFNLEHDSKTFFLAVAFVYSIVPVLAGEVVARFLPGYKTS